MKSRIFKAISIKWLFCISTLAFVLLQSCGDSHHDPSPKEVNTNILVSHPWNLNSLTVDGTDKTSLFPGMTLTITAGNYTTTHGSPVWAPSGTWTMSDDGKTITRDDGITVGVEALTTDGLTLSLNWTKTTYGGRTSSIAGNHVFKFVK